MIAGEASSGGTLQPPVGIDLGTSYSVLAYLDQAGRPITIPNSAGDLLTRSAVLIEDDGLVVGDEACKNAIDSPDSYAELFKRDMGSDFYCRPLRGQRVPPEVLSGFVLERLKKDAEARLGPIRDVVVTVPAFFDELRRKATQDAGRLAGLQVLDIINEPTAAALAFAYQCGLLNPSNAVTGPELRRLLVYDLGGGTFDVTILEIAGESLRTIATDGDVCLGGRDFDERLVNDRANKFLAAQGMDPRSDPQDALQLWRDAEDVKHSLTERTKTTVACFHAGIRMRMDVTRAEFEGLTRDLIERTRSTSSLVLKQAGLRWEQIDRVLLVGGATRMPMVSEMLLQLSGKEPDRSVSPDEAVAQGAALYAGMLTRQAASGTGPAYRLTNVNSHSLGVVGTHAQTGRKSNVILIPKNTPLPHHAAKTFKTSEDDMRSIQVSVLEGESNRPEDCVALGKCMVRDLPPGLPKGTEVIVEFHYEANGRLSVLSRVPRTRQSAQVQIVRQRQDELQSLAAWRTKLGTRAGDQAKRSLPARSAESASPEATSRIRFDCTGCGQKLQVTDEFAGKKIKCPNCGAAVLVPSASGHVIRPSTSAPKLVPIPSPANPAKGNVQPPDLPPPPIAGFRASPLAARRETGARWAKSSRLDTPAKIGVLAGGVVFGLIMLVGGIALIRNDRRESINLQQETARTVGPTRNRTTKVEPSPEGAAAACAGCGACGAGVVAIPILYFILNIALLVWVARNAKARGMDSAVIWMILVMFTNLLGLVIYLFARPQGNLIRCASCGNNRLQASRQCPHCGNA
ncbi:MAG: Hsp70 family protein [Planctomycetia bacterium]|nr:Hsp70 family protein [Planctomycetia bacterium]